MNHKIIFLLIIIINNCSSCKQKIDNDLEKMYSMHIEIDTTGMEKVIPENNIFEKNTSEEYRLIVYYDSTECMSCAMNKMNDWHKLLSEIYNNHHNTSVLFLFSPRIEDVKSIKYNYKVHKFGHEIFIDYKYQFKKSNPDLPPQKMYHVFLLNKFNQIVFVGDPRTSVKMHELFFKVISSSNSV